MASEDKQAAGSAQKTANAASNNSMDVALHPLVILSISDQYTRARLTAPADGRPVRVFGVLLGVQQHNGAHVELTNSFDMIATFDPATGALVSVDEEFLAARQTAFATVFPDTTVLGWYQTGDAVSPEDTAVLSRALARYVETPLVALLDAARAYSDETRDIPLQVFESELAGDSSSPHLLLKPVSYHVIVCSYSPHLLIFHSVFLSSLFMHSRLLNPNVSELTTSQNPPQLKAHLSVCVFSLNEYVSFCVCVSRCLFFFLSCVFQCR